ADMPRSVSLSSLVTVPAPPGNLVTDFHSFHFHASPISSPSPVNDSDFSETVNLEPLTARVATKAFESFSLTVRTYSSIRLSFLFTTLLTSDREVRISFPSGVIIFDSPK